MTTPIAIWLAIIIAAIFGANYVLGDGDLFLFLARQFITLVEWVSFWR